MTTENFEQAREIKQNIDEAMDVVTLLGNLKIYKQKGSNNNDRF